MEWVETTGRTIEEAKDAALDQLGVDEQEAEFEILEEPKAGLFGRVRREARVRARVRPTRPRPKVERRDRRRKGTERKGAGERTEGGAAGGSGGRSRGGEQGPAGAPTKRTVAPASGHDVSRDAPATADAPARGEQERARRKATPQREGDEMTDDVVSVATQADLTVEFLEGLLAAFGVDAEITTTQPDEDVIEVEVNGGDLGLLIGPKGHTYAAVQELARTYVQRKASGRHQGKVRLDIGGYRRRRREALARFASQVAADVLSSGVQKALEPMSPADRKVVHDTVNEIDGVSTLSEGQEPNRRVVIVPAP